MANKIRVGVVYGGRSAEHEISLLSARNVIAALDRDKYEVFALGIDRQGQWYLSDADATSLTINATASNQVTLVTQHNQAGIIHVNDATPLQALDVVFPVLHGPYGEDGTIQGLLKLVNLPFVGADVLAHAVGMDKDVTKRLLQQAGIKVAPWVTVHRRQLPALDFTQVIETLGLPCFVKPANMGSSVGISKVTQADQLASAVAESLRYDHKVIIEQAINGREIECAVLGNDEVMASVPGEIIPNDAFYSYAAKYITEDGARLQAPAELSAALVAKVQALAIQVFQALCAEAMARVDFFLTPENELYVNEINTIPGFTNISMYPRLWQLSGIGYAELLDRLINLALEKFDRDQSLAMTPEHA